jgi:hypothetical protein
VIGWLLDRTSRAGVAISCSLLGALTFLLIPFLRSEPAIPTAFAIIGATTFALYTCALTILGERFSGGMLVAGTAASHSLIQSDQLPESIWANRFATH